MSKTDRKAGRPGTRGATPAQFVVLCEIDEFCQSHQYPPTFRELAELLDVTHVTIYIHTKHLRKKKLVAFEEHESRTLRLTDTGRRALARAANAADEP